MSDNDNDSRTTPEMLIHMINEMANLDGIEMDSVLIDRETGVHFTYTTTRASDPATLAQAVIQTGKFAELAVVACRGNGKGAHVHMAGQLQGQLSLEASFFLPIDRRHPGSN